MNRNQIRALLRTGELRGIQVGGRGVWRIGAIDIEDFIAEAYRRRLNALPQVTSRRGSPVVDQPSCCS